MNLPREILDLISTFLHPFEVKDMANSFGFIDDKQSNRIWRSIFADDVWLNKAISYGAEPVLVGCRLNRLSVQGSDRKPIYMILHANDFSGDTFYDGIDCLRQSLRKKHRYNSKSNEVTFPECKWLNMQSQQVIIPKIVLNVRDIVRCAETLDISKKNSRKLFERNNLRTMYSFYREPEIRILERPHIAGIGGPISEVGAISPICAMNLQSRKKKWQVILQEPDCPGVVPIFENQEKRRPHEIIAWQYK